MRPRWKALDAFEAEVEEHREAISPTAAGTTKFVLNLLMSHPRFKKDEAAQEALMRFLDEVQQHPTMYNRKHEEWREQMRERRRADKMADEDAPQEDSSRELEVM